MDPRGTRGIINTTIYNKIHWFAGSLGQITRILQEIMKKNTWNIRHLVDESCPRNPATQHIILKIVGFLITTWFAWSHRDHNKVTNKQRSNKSTKSIKTLKLYMAVWWKSRVKNDIGRFIRYFKQRKISNIYFVHQLVKKCE